MTTGRRRAAVGLVGAWPPLLSHRRDIRDRLLRAYGDPARGYHDLLHLSEVLEHLREILPDEGHRGVDPTAVLLGAWFHDAVYDRHGDNEERSALLARRQLAPAGLPPSLVEEVVRLVLLTSTHRPAPDDLAGQVLCDADLAILAAPSQRYAEYAAGVRREYAHVSEQGFRTGRSAVLRDLLERPALFGTDHGRRHWEGRARANLSRELRELSAF